jgi:hypothetical protein
MQFKVGTVLGKSQFTFWWHGLVEVKNSSQAKQQNIHKLLQTYDKGTRW